MNIFKIELAKEKDIKKVFDLSNDPLVRQNSFNSDEIFWEDHVKWFTNKINDSDCVYYIINNEEGEFVGQVRFDKLTDDNYLIGISLTKEFRGRGIGALVLKQATGKFVNDFKVKKVYAYVKIDNLGSIKSFLKIGYKIIELNKINNFDAFKFEYEIK